MSFIKDYSRSFQGCIIIMFNYTEVKNFCTLLYMIPMKNLVDYHLNLENLIIRIIKQEFLHEQL